MLLCRDVAEFRGQFSHFTFGKNWSKGRTVAAAWQSVLKTKECHILREWKVIKMASYKCTAKLLDFFKGFNPLFFYFNCVDHVFYYWNFNHRLNWITIFVKMNTRKKLKKRRVIHLKLPDLRLPFRRILRNPEKREDRLLWERTLRWTSCAPRSRTWSDELWCLCPNTCRRKIAR